MSRHYDDLKLEPTGTKKGLEKLKKIFRYGNKLSIEEQVDFIRVLVRARGRVVADLVLKGEMESDEQEENMRGFMIADNLLKRAEAGQRVDFKAFGRSRDEVGDDILEFIRRLGRNWRK